MVRYFSAFSQQEVTKWRKVLPTGFSASLEASWDRCKLTVHVSPLCILAHQILFVPECKNQNHWGRYMSVYFSHLFLGPAWFQNPGVLGIILFTSGYFCRNIQRFIAYFYFIFFILFYENKRLLNDHKVPFQIEGNKDISLSGKVTLFPFI